jgi:hypothetical protein
MFLPPMKKTFDVFNIQFIFFENLQLIFHKLLC